VAQLIKLRDYISRYELDIYRYPSQFIRLKKERWEKLYHSWENNLNEEVVEQEPKNKKSFFSKFSPFRKKVKVEEEKVSGTSEPLPSTEDALRLYFLNQLYPFQLKWATSSISQVSFMDQKYKKDAQLKYFLKRFPDNYFVMYYPVFNIKKAPIDAEIILISPIHIEIIYLLDDFNDATVMVTDDRTWKIEKNDTKSMILSPIHALKRTEKLVRSILKKNDISFPIKKTVLTKNNFVIFQQEPYNTFVIGKHEYVDWFKERRALDSPLKSSQLKAADQLLKYCLTTSVKRPEWEEDTEGYTTVGEG